jgi:hypothetical protein
VEEPRRKKRRWPRKSEGRARDSARFARARELLACARMKRWLLLLAACSAPPTAAPDAAAPAASSFPADFVTDVANSGWVFRAKVTSAQPDQVIVQIEKSSLEPLEAPLPPGTSDTVILTGPPLAVGDEAYFLVGWQSAGQTWTFTENARLPGTLDFDLVHRAVHDAHRYLLDQQLATALVASPRVIDATVTGVTPDPQPCDDCIQYDTVTVSPWHTLRGTVSIDPVTVDVEAGTTHVGDRDLFLLDGAGHASLAPFADLERVRSLLTSPPEPPSF